MKRILVTGASGCVGRHALPLLAGRGWEVHGVTTRAGVPTQDGVIWHHANLLDAHEAARVVRDAGASHLLHLAWYIAPGKWAAAPENFQWVEASLGLVRAFLDHGGTRIVSAGSCLEYDWGYGYCSEDRTPCVPHTAYGTCKNALQLLTSAMTAREGVSSAWGRIFFLYGPYEHPDRLVPSVISALLAGEPARCSHGNQVRDYLHAADVASAFVGLVESGVAGPVNIASGEAVRLKDIVTRIGSIIGRPELIRLGAIPPAATDTPLVVADTSRLASELAWTPRYDLESGLRQTIDWWASVAASASLSAARGDR